MILSLSSEESSNPLCSKNNNKIINYTISTKILLVVLVVAEYLFTELVFAVLYKQQENNTIGFMPITSMSSLRSVINQKKRASNVTSNTWRTYSIKKCKEQDGIVSLRQLQNLYGILCLSIIGLQCTSVYCTCTSYYQQEKVVFSAVRTNFGYLQYSTIIASGYLLAWKTDNLP